MPGIEESASPLWSGERLTWQYPYGCLWDFHGNGRFVTCMFRQYFLFVSCVAVNLVAGFTSGLFLNLESALTFLKASNIIHTCLQEWIRIIVAYTLFIRTNRVHDNWQVLKYLKILKKKTHWNSIFFLKSIKTKNCNWERAITRQQSIDVLPGERTDHDILVNA